jgi:hypothetical protein
MDPKLYNYTWVCPEQHFSIPLLHHPLGLYQAAQIVPCRPPVGLDQRALQAMFQYLYQKIQMVDNREVARSQDRRDTLRKMTAETKSSLSQAYVQLEQPRSQIAEIAEKACTTESRSKSIMLQQA